jgi:hypothetical protein
MRRMRVDLLPLLSASTDSSLGLALTTVKEGP